MKKHPVLVGVVGGIVATLLLGVAVWLTIAYTGVYNVAASDQHFDPVRWTFNTTLRRSVAMRAGGANLPEDTSDDLLAQGAGYYAESCAYCHRSEEHTSELQSLMRISSAVFCLKKKKKQNNR